MAEMGDFFRIKLPKSLTVIKEIIIVIKSTFFAFYFLFIFGIPYHAPNSIIHLYDIFNNREYSTIFFVTILFLFTFGIHNFFEQLEYHCLKFYIIKKGLISGNKIEGHKIKRIRYLVLENYNTSSVVNELLNKQFLKGQEIHNGSHSSQISYLKLIVLIIWLIFGIFFSILFSINFNFILNGQSEYLLSLIIFLLFSYLYFKEIIPHGKKYKKERKNKEYKGNFI